MQEIPLSAQARKERGKGPARRTRAKGLIPATVYGPEREAESIAVNEREFIAVMRKAARVAVINLSIDDGKEDKVLVRETQRDPITSDIRHIDFQAISMNKPIYLSIPIEFVGTPTGVRDEGGIMQTPMRELAVQGLPADIPDNVTVDVSELSIGDAIHVETLSIPNVEILDETQRTMVNVVAPTIIKVDEPTEEEELAEGEEGEVAEGEEGAEAAEGEGEEKKAEGEEKKEGKEKE